jgi:hypothetical protein
MTSHSLKTVIIFTENRNSATTLKQMFQKPQKPGNMGQNTSFAFAHL